MILLDYSGARGTLIHEKNLSWKTPLNCHEQNAKPLSSQDAWNLFTTVLYPFTMLSATGPLSMALTISTDVPSSSKNF